MNPQPPLLKGIAPELHGRGESILHLDDEPSVTASVQRLLLRLGYQVVSFNAPLAATEHFRLAPHTFDLVITDLMMPGMTGLEFATEVRTLRPTVPIILLSALADAQNPEALIDHGIHSVIMKPAGIESIATSVRRALDSSPLSP